MMTEPALSDSLCDLTVLTLCFYVLMYFCGDLGRYASGRGGLVDIRGHQFKY